MASLASSPEKEVMEERFLLNAQRGFISVPVQGNLVRFQVKIRFLEQPERNLHLDPQPQLVLSASCIVPGDKDPRISRGMMMWKMKGNPSGLCSSCPGHAGIWLVRAGQAGVEVRLCGASPREKAGDYTCSAGGLLLTQCPGGAFSLNHIL